MDEGQQEHPRGGLLLSMGWTCSNRIVNAQKCFHLLIIRRASLV